MPRSSFRSADRGPSLCYWEGAGSCGAFLVSGSVENGMGKLDGKITIVTGATSGIGRRTVEIFVAEGAKVVATGRREELGRSLEQALGKDNCLFVKADATQEADVVRMM